jgi:two-component system nitrate/nitrite response regulator NarL
MIRVATVDDHPMFLDGLRRVLKSMEHIEIVAQGKSADDACRIAQEVRPDVMLLDIDMPGNGLDAAERILAADPERKIVMLTASVREDQLSRAIALGVQGYVMKAGGIGELQTAIRSVDRGERYVSVGLAVRALQSRLVEQQAPAQAPATPPAKSAFTPAERRILDLVALGHTNKQIAEQLNLAIPTVKNALRIAFFKLGVHTRLQALLAWRKI